MQEYDASSKWLIEHHGDSILRLGGVRGIAWWRPLQAELVQSRRLPDGLIEAKLRGQARPARFLVEISTYPYRRLGKQVIEGTVLAYLDRGELPEVLTLVLHPGGRKGVGGVAELASPRDWTRLRLEWRMIELWTIPATELLVDHPCHRTARGQRRGADPLGAAGEVRRPTRADLPGVPGTDRPRRLGRRSREPARRDPAPGSPEL